MSCADARRQLTGYLDGDLAGDRGTLVRGHLRTCEDCRRVASDEAALRDGLRTLAPVDPPAALWAGIQAQLAAAEVAESRRPAWRRALARWAPVLPRYAVGGVLAAATVAVVMWRMQPAPEAAEQPVAPAPVVALAAIAPAPTPLPGAASCAQTSTADVTRDLASDAARLTGCYAQAADELRALVAEVRPQWSADEAAAFDAQVAALDAEVAGAAPGRPQQKAARALVRYLQRAVVRDDIALASVGGGR